MGFAQLAALHKQVPWGVPEKASDPAKVEDQVQFLARTFDSSSSHRVFCFEPTWKYGMLVSVNACPRA